MKKILALVLVSVLALFVLAGCNQKKNTTFVIGGIGPTTGGAAVYGTAVKNAMMLAADEINAAGGINGVKIEINFQDDAHDAEKAVNAYNKLKDSNMHLLIGTVTSTPCIAVVAKADQDNIFMLTPSGSAVDAIDAPNAFRVCFSDPEQGTAAANYIKENSLAQSVAVIYNSSDSYSTGIYEKFNEQAKALGLNIVTAETFTSENADNFASQLQKVKSSGADLLFLPIYYQEAAKILTQADNIDLDVKFFGCDGLDGVIGELGDNAALAEGVMLLTPFAAIGATEPEDIAFTEAYYAKYNEYPNQFAADAYDAVYIVKAAIEKAGVKDPSISASDLCDKIVAAMDGLEYKGVTGTMTWDVKTGEPTKTADAMVIKDGAYVSMASVLGAAE